MLCTGGNPYLNVPTRMEVRGDNPRFVSWGGSVKPLEMSVLPDNPRLEGVDGLGSLVQFPKGQPDCYPSTHGGLGILPGAGVAVDIAASLVRSQLAEARDIADGIILATEMESVMPIDDVYPRLGNIVNPYVRQLLTEAADTAVSAIRVKEANPNEYWTVPEAKAAVDANLALARAEAEQGKGLILKLEGMEPKSFADPLSTSPGLSWEEWAGVVKGATSETFDMYADAAKGVVNSMKYSAKAAVDAAKRVGAKTGEAFDKAESLAKWAVVGVVALLGLSVMWKVS